ncbi:MAG: ABC transporter permease [Spirochaetales bacterium]
MSGYAHHLAFDFRSGIRDATLMLMNYLFPIGFFVMIGLFMPTINPAFLEIMIPGLVTFALMSGTLMTIPSTIVDQRNAGVLRSYRVNGVPAMALITIPMLGALVHMVIVSGFITVGGGLVFGATLPSNWVWFAAIVILTTLSLATLSVLIGIVAPSPRAATLLTQAVFVPSVLLGGLMVPSALLPAGVARGASLLPATQAMRAFGMLAMEGGRTAAETTTNGLMAGGLVPVIILAASIALNLALCVALFRWNPRTHNMRSVLALLALVPFVLGAALM